MLNPTVTELAEGNVIKISAVLSHTIVVLKRSSVMDEADVNVLSDKLLIVFPLKPDNCKSLNLVVLNMFNPLSDDVIAVSNVIVDMSSNDRFLLPTFVCGGKLIVEPFALSCALPKLIVLPLRYKSLNLAVEVPKSYVTFAEGITC
jgi:hypothetical protein